MADSKVKSPMTLYSVEIDTTTTSNGNAMIPLVYDDGVPVAIKAKTEGAENVFGVIGRWSDADLNGYWGFKALGGLATGGNINLLKNTRIIGTVYYLRF